MADHLTSEREDTLSPRVERSRPLARVQGAPWLIVVVLLAAVAWLTWRAFFHHAEGDPVGSAMMAFEKQNSLTVFSSRFETVAESTDARGVLGLDLLKSRQAMIVPATVEYRLDLSRMKRSNFTWNSAEQTLDVTLPPLNISRPNLDEAHARVFTQGNFVTRDASTALSQNNSAQAERNAAEFARNPEILSLARQAATQAVQQNLAVPLHVAGYDQAKVTVHFAQ
ncbi:MAG: DUF4230 domain-containing protein [Tsuneonella sp.]